MGLLLMGAHREHRYRIRNAVAYYFVTHPGFGALKVGNRYPPLRPGKDENDAKDHDEAGEDLALLLVLAKVRGRRRGATGNVVSLFGRLLKWGILEGWLSQCQVVNSNRYVVNHQGIRISPSELRRNTCL